MTTEYLLKALYETGRKMRDQQILFFTTKDNVARKAFLSASKQWEKKFDELISQTKILLEENKS